MDARAYEWNLVSAGRRLALGLLASSALTAPALAQEAPAPDVATITELVVTAQRREESINDVGMAIQAFGAEHLKDMRVTNVQDLSTVAPSFSVSQSYQGVPIYTLRGIGFNTINLSATSTVGSYVDEVAYAYPFMLTGPIFDLERVEVLKGPQGTLYGRNTTAGLVGFITAKPTDEFKASVTAEIGNYDTHNVEGFVSGPLSDTLRARVAFRVDNSDKGWQVSNTRGERLGDIHRWGLRGLLAWEPTDNLSIDLSLSGWRNNSDPLAAQALGFTRGTGVGSGSYPFNAPGVEAYMAANRPTNPKQADWAPGPVREADVGTGLGIDGPLGEDNTFFAAALRVTYEINDDLRLVSLTGYNDLERKAVFDWSGAPYEILVQDAYGKVESISEELRLEGATDRVNWLVGAYYGEDTILDSNRTILGQNANVGLIRFLGGSGLFNAFNTAGYTPTQLGQAFRTFRDVGDIEARTQSLFGNASWTLSDQLELTTGLRYTQDKHTYSGCSRDFNGNMLPNVNVVNRGLFFAAYGLVAPIGVGDCNTFNPTTRKFQLGTHTLDEDNVSARLALNWKPTEDMTLYASLSRGAKVGNTPINAANISTQNAPANQEILVAYEAGVKASLFERRLQANLAAFYYDYEDKQLSVLFADPIYTALARLDNIPESEALGIDADLTWRPTGALTVMASATWLQTKIGDYVGVGDNGGPQDFTGSEFPYSPTWQTSLTAVYNGELSETLGWQATLNGRYQSDSAADFGTNPLYRIDSYAVVNGSLGIHDLSDRWRLSVWGKNLFDEYYWSSVASNANLVVRFPSPPRTFGASLTVNF